MDECISSFGDVCSFRCIFVSDVTQNVFMCWLHGYCAEVSSSFSKYGVKFNSKMIIWIEHGFMELECNEILVALIFQNFFETVQ